METERDSTKSSTVRTTPPRSASAGRIARGIAPVLFGLVALLVLNSIGVTAAAGAAPTLHAETFTASERQFNRPGDLLITDQFNNRVIEVNPLTKQIVWSFGSGNSQLCNPGPGSVIAPNDAERLSGGLTLISGTGVSPGTPGLAPCVDNRVIVVNEAGGIVWQYGVAGKTGSGYNRLNTPVFAIQLPNHDFLITDQGNNRIIEVNFAKQIVWSYGPTSGPGALNSPNSAELLKNGNILIADESNNRVIEIDRAGHIVWEFQRGLNTVGFASLLPNGDTLIADSGNNRILEVTASKQVIFQYYTNLSRDSNATPNPTNAVEIQGGDIVISDQFNDRVIVINPESQVVFQYGETNHPGVGFDQLYAPYTAYEVGDYTGQTAPPAQFDARA
jgi:hypothetical protein